MNDGFSGDGNAVYTYPAITDSMMWRKQSVILFHNILKQWRKM